MTRIVSMLTILLVTACGAVDWSFDHDAGGDDATGHVVEASASDDDAEGPPPVQDSGAHETGVVAETGPALEAGPACSMDSDCPTSIPLCSPSGDCIRCKSSSDCHSDSGAPACNTSTGSCVQCTLSADCAGNAALPYCDTNANVCVRCLSNLDCGLEAICQPTTHTCTRIF